MTPEIIMSGIILLLGGAGAIYLLYKGIKETKKRKHLHGSIIEGSALLIMTLGFVLSNLNFSMGNSIKSSIWLNYSIYISIFISGGWGLYQLVLSVMSMTWKKTQGQVGTSSYEYIGTYHDDSTNQRVAQYQYRFSYHYSVNGKSYHSSLMSLGNDQNETIYRSEMNAEDFKRRFPINHHVEVYYNPNNPAQSVLKISVIGAQWIVPILIAVAAFFVLRYFGGEINLKPEKANDNKQKTNVKQSFTSMEEALKHPNEVIELNLSNQNLSNLSQDIGKFVTLKVLNVSGNRLTQLPQAFYSLSKVEKLNISKNQFKMLREDICSPHLKVLILDENPLSNVSKSLHYCSSLDTLSIQKVPLQSWELSRLEDMMNGAKIVR